MGGRRDWRGAASDGGDFPWILERDCTRTLFVHGSGAGDVSSQDSRTCDGGCDSGARLPASAADSLHHDPRTASILQTALFRRTWRGRVRCALLRMLRSGLACRTGVYVASSPAFPHGSRLDALLQLPHERRHEAGLPFDVHPRVAFCRNADGLFPPRARVGRLHAGPSTRCRGVRLADTEPHSRPELQMASHVPLRHRPRHRRGCQLLHLHLVRWLGGVCEGRRRHAASLRDALVDAVHPCGIRPGVGAGVGHRRHAVRRLGDSAAACRGRGTVPAVPHGRGLLRDGRALVCPVGGAPPALVLDVEPRRDDQFALLPSRLDAFLCRIRGLRARRDGGGHLLS